LEAYRPILNSSMETNVRQMCSLVALKRVGAFLTGLYIAALDRLSGEVALVEHITEGEAVLELESLVIAGARGAR